MTQPFELSDKAAGAVLYRVPLGEVVAAELVERRLPADDVVGGHEQVMAGRAGRFGWASAAADLVRCAAR